MFAQVVSAYSYYYLRVFFVKAIILLSFIQFFPSFRGILFTEHG